MRETVVNRKTNETDIKLSLNIDGTGVSNINSGVGFMDHMLTLFSKHGRFDLTLECKGDTYVDDHHSVEDIGIALGEAFSKCVGDKKGIKRYASLTLPMDEALVMEAVDVSGRSYLNFDLKIPTQKVGTFDTELIKDFFLAFTRNFPISLHLISIAGENSHHIIEGAFKAFGRLLNEALTIDERFKDEIPSTKGTL